MSVYLISRDEVVDIDLEQIYKTHSQHSHEYALQVIFAKGVAYAEDKYPKANEALPEPDPEVERTLVKQTLGMGNNFKE